MPQYAPLRTVVIVMIALYLAMFLVSLVDPLRPQPTGMTSQLTWPLQDRIIISTAIPRITDEFDSIQDIGWYGSAYVLTACTTQLLFGRLFSFYPQKYVFLSAIVLFEVGSALCGASPSSIAFILGRAIAGAGAAGIFGGTIVIMIPLVPLEKRPMYQGLLGAIFGVSSVIGPLIGGAFTKNPSLTWRWCFYINLPVGAVSIVLIALFLHIPAPPKSKLTAAEKLKQLDPLGNLIFTPSIVSLLLALQWGGSTYSWHDGRIIALLAVFGVSFIAWIAVQALHKKNATVPPRIFLQRSIAAAMIYSMCMGGVMLSVGYYIAIWFQAIQGLDAFQAGIRTLPFVLALVAAAIVSGGLVSRFGYYTPFVIACSCIMSIGAGLLTTLKPSSGSPEWIGYQFLVGFGMGLGQQQSGLAAQAVLAHDDIPIGVSLMFFGQNLGGAIFLCVTQNVFIGQLLRDLSAVLPAASASVLAGVGATDLSSLVQADLLPAVLAAYNKAITTTMFVPLAITCFSILPALAFEWKSVKGLRGGKKEVDGSATAV